MISITSNYFNFSQSLSSGNTNIFTVQLLHDNPITAAIEENIQGNTKPLVKIKPT